MAVRSDVILDVLGGLAGPFEPEDDPLLRAVLARGHPVPAGRVRAPRRGAALPLGVVAVGEGDLHGGHGGHGDRRGHGARLPATRQTGIEVSNSAGWGGAAAGALGAEHYECRDLKLIKSRHLMCTRYGTQRTIVKGAILSSLEMRLRETKIKFQF